MRSNAVAIEQATRFTPCPSVCAVLTIIVPVVYMALGLNDFDGA